MHLYAPCAQTRPKRRNPIAGSDRVQGNNIKLELSVGGSAVQCTLCNWKRNIQAQNRRCDQHNTLSASQRAAAPPSAVAREVGPSTACTELMLARLLIALLCHTTLSTCIYTAAASFARSCASTYLLVSLQMEFWDVVQC